MTTLAVPSTPLTPDQYQSYAEQDPGFLQLKSTLAANENAYRSSLRGGINSAAINLGVVPTDASVAQYIDPTTGAAAAANPLSTNAQLNTLHTNNLRSLQNNLAARGAYDSGELTYGLGNENTRDTQARADALSSFMQYANGLFGNLGSMQASDATQLGTELGNAAMRQLALHPGTTTTAVWNDSTGTYVDSAGNQYDQFGNHITTAGSGSQPTAFGVGGNPIPNVGLAADWSYNNPTGLSQYPDQTTYTPPPAPVLTQGASPLIPRGQAIAA